MRKLTTFLCSIAFAISGICLANMTSGKSMTAMSAQASNLPTIDVSKMSMPVDLQLNHMAQNKDSTVSVKTDTVYVKQTKFVKVRVPSKIKTRTVHVPVLYIATRTHNKEDSVSDNTDIMYKIHKIGKCDLKQINSSIDIN